MEQGLKKGMRVDHLFGFEKWGLLAYLNEDKELVESRNCREDTGDVVTRVKVTKEKQVKTNQSREFPKNILELKKWKIRDYSMMSQDKPIMAFLVNTLLEDKSALN